MPYNRSTVVHPRNANPDGTAHFFRARFRTFEIPLVRDAMILGKEAPTRLETLVAMLKLATPEVFVGVPVQDDVIGAIIVRESLLKKLPLQQIENFARQRVKPFMSASEVLRLDLDVEIIMETSV